MGVQKAIGYIYKITSPSNKVYIGQTIDLKTRISKYRNLNCKNQTRIFNSLVKYGWDNHIFEIIEIVININILSEREVYFINFYNSFKTGLNCTLGGEGCVGKIVSEASRKKMSESAKGKIQSKETIAKRIAKTTGLKRDDVFKNKIRQAQTGRKHSEKTKEKLRNINKGNISLNKIKCKLIDLETLKFWEADSLMALALKCPISLTTITRIKKLNKLNKLHNKYKLEYGK